MKLKLLVAALAIAGMGAPALAALPVGDPYEGDSWSQAFYEIAGGGPTFAPGPFDTIVIQMTSPGDSFESVAISGFNLPGWQVTYANDTTFPTYVVAKGDVVTLGQQLNFTIKFAGTTSNQLQFQYAAFLDGELVLHQEMDWNPGWDIHDGDPDLVPILIPLPAPIWLGMAGLAGVAFVRRRKTI